MARLISQNIITAPTGMNKDYWQDYVDAAKSKGDIWKGVGEIVQGAEDTYDDYLNRKRNAETDAMNKDRFEREKATYEQQVADRAKRLQMVKDFLANNTDERYNSPEGKAAQQAFIEGDLDAFNKLRDRWSLAEMNKKSADDAFSEKEAEEQEKDTSKAISQVLLDMGVSALTDKQLKEMDNGKRQKYLNTLNRLHKTANDHGLTSIVRDIETQQIRLQSGYEKGIAANAAASASNAKQKQAEADAGLF